MKTIIVISLVVGLASVAYAQRTTKNNYTGDWTDANSWQIGPPPPATITNTHLDVTINGYITFTGNINVTGTAPETFTVNDTLVVLGDMSFGSNAAPLNIGPDAVLIVIGNVSFSNNTTINNQGIFVVSGNAAFHNGASENYNGSPDGQFFVGGTVTDNAVAEASDIWPLLDDLHPVIYDFVTCKTGGGSNCLLPVILSYFVADLRGNTVQLEWATTMEENFREFVVQRSTNGTEFEEIGSVEGKGFDIYDIESKYAFTDSQPLIGNNYYRLKAIDLDDQFEYFGVKMVKILTPKHLTVYPNPSSGGAIFFSTNFNPGESARILIVNQLGVEVFRGPARAREADISFTDKLRAGIYFLRYVSEDFQQTARIVVRN